MNSREEVEELIEGLHWKAAMDRERGGAVSERGGKGVWKERGNQKDWWRDTQIVLIGRDKEIHKHWMKEQTLKTERREIESNKERGA